MTTYSGHLPEPVTGITGELLCAEPRVTVQHQEPRTDRRRTRLLNPRLDLVNHSPAGLAWGYFGSGPSQLSLALLADATGHDALALRLHQQFKEEVVAQWSWESGWQITRREILNWTRERTEYIASARARRLQETQP